ncbi:MAG TPA: hypothetical protein VMV45_11005 [Casimicrobiaceae bacterium]|nr:hypothetical protein [Casimicrobiaceae bacterium]
MFLAHFGAAMAARQVAPRPSLGTLILAAQWDDVIWPIFLLLGFEHVVIAPGVTAAVPLDFVSYPFSHSLAADVIWAALFAAVYAWRTGDRRGAGWLAALVLSHWVIDALSHRPDVPVWPGGPVVGAGLWDHFAATVVIELVALVAGAWIYSRATIARDRLGSVSFWAMVIVLAALYLASVLGPPPPGVTALALTSLIGGLVLLAWAYWIDRHRAPRAAL